MPLTDEQREQFNALLAEADASDLGDYVPKAALKGRLTDKDRAAKALQAEYTANLEALKAEHSTALAELEDLKKRDMSASERIAAELTAKDAQIEAAIKARENEAQRFTAERLARSQDYLNAELSNMLSSGPRKPANLRHAMLAAKDELAIQVNDADGTFSIAVTKDGLPVDDPRAAVSNWFEQQTHLQTKTGTEIPSPGAGRPPGDPPPRDPTEGMTEAQAFRFNATRFTSTEG